MDTIFLFVLLCIICYIYSTTIASHTTLFDFGQKDDNLVTMRNIIIVAFFIVSCVRSCKQMRCGGSSHGHWQPTNFRFQAIGAGTSVALIAQCLATAEQYPSPSSSKNPEGKTESLIGRWLTTNPSKRKDIVIATKITGGRNVNKENIMRDCEGVLLYLLLLSFALYPYQLGSLRRLKTDYIDVYQLHWPARYSPQANWGQSLNYIHDGNE